jgi:ParB family chromosome partitioning protein
MAKAIQKITLDRSEDIPFDKLELSQKNVRAIKAGVSIEDLANDIALRGLLMSLNVRPIHAENDEETGRYEVPAGGRRYRALELLIKQKRMAQTEPIPCIVKRGGATSAEDDSLAENVHRLQLHPLDQFRAFQTLHLQGLREEDIAARFFVSVSTVRQRLRLASVSPRLLELYANDEMKLEQVMAFSIANDQVRQEQVWDTVSRSHVQEPYYIRRLLTETAVRAADRRAVYVGIQVYKAAGGVVMRDLFNEDNGGWLQDPALLEQLVFEKLNADAEFLKAEEGWKWIDAAIDFHYGHTSGLRRFYGERAEFTAEELARYDGLKTEYDKLGAEYAEAENYSEETESRLEALVSEMDRLNDRPYVFDPGCVARGGAFVSLSASGALKIERGFVRPEDEPAIEAGGGNDAGDRNAEPDDGAAAAATSGISIDVVLPLSDRIIEDLTATRTVALRNALANDPVMAFVAALHVFVLKTFFVYGSASCLEVTPQSAEFAQTPGLGDTVWAKEIEQRHDAWGHDLPKDAGEVWDYLIALDEVSRQALFAHCVSLSLNAVVQPWNRRPAAIAHAEQLARSIGFDMAKAGWTPTVENYLGRVTKAQILQAVREAKGEQSAKSIGQLKRPDMAREAARLLQGSGWLPEPLCLAVDEAPAVNSDNADDGGVEDGTFKEAGVNLPVHLTKAVEGEDAATDDVDLEDPRHFDAVE